MASPNSDESNSLKANFSSPAGQRTFEYSLPNKPSTEETSTSYLSSLRKAAIKMQNDVNVFLTQKMEEDKAAVGTDGSINAGKVDEDKEEDNYGEEVDED